MADQKSRARRVDPAAGPAHAGERTAESDESLSFTAPFAKVGSAVLNLKKLAP